MSSGSSGTEGTREDGSGRDDKAKGKSLWKVDGLIRLMEGENTGPINIGNPGEFTMTELAETVKEMINPEVKIVRVENTPDDPRQRKPDITKAKELLGWEPKIKLRDGIPLMEEDFRKRLEISRKN
ncbi:UDP-glucuronic acid decarboxylase 3 [Castilleja foliolosa]|uniref:UDP-glucuronic acid decarboxylase 3 n=1 Tax=Castilleja foliolosa TaxID=1961234 RepID=A0ABD3EM25_9LAMI